MNNPGLSVGKRSASMGLLVLPAAEPCSVATSHFSHILGDLSLRLAPAMAYTPWLLLRVFVPFLTRHMITRKSERNIRRLAR